MNTKQLKECITQMNTQARKALSSVYTEPDSQKQRILKAITEFEALFGDEREVFLLSVPGRSEILGNHTDHNRGKVLAGAIDRDIIAVVSKNESGIVNLKSEGYDKDTVDLSLVESKDAYPKYSSASLILGIAKGFMLSGFSVGGFDGYATSDVLRGSGISSSAAFEVMIGNIMNHLYNGGKVKNTDIAKISQFAENEYFGKPCGLMDQMACAVGGFVYMDFEDPKSPEITPIAFSLTDVGYSLCIVNTGGNHADLNEDYASVPAEMKAVAALFGKDALRGLSENDIVCRASEIRGAAGDRALLRAVHFIRENERVEKAKEALLKKSTEEFFDKVISSGRSSFEYLQNVYTTKNVGEQGLSLALLLTEGFPSDKRGAWRVHGGGFAGTVQAYCKNEGADEYIALMESVFGKGAVMRLTIRAVGACRLL